MLWIEEGECSLGKTRSNIFSCNRNPSKFASLGWSQADVIAVVSPKSPKPGIGRNLETPCAAVSDQNSV